MKDNRLITCRNDVLFKVLCLMQKELLYEIVQQTTSQKVNELTVLNPEILPHANEGKKSILDILLRDENGNYYDIEMQNGSLTKEQVLRFILYISRLYIKQAVAGEKLSTQIKDVYGIILLNDGIPFNGLIRHDIMNVNGDVLDGIRQHLIIVNMPYIDKIVKEKGIAGLNSFERIIYALRTNINDDILEIGDRMVTKMNKNKLAFLFGDSIEADYAFKRELLLAEEEAKEERWKENEERMKENEERMKENEERMKEKEERMKEKEERMKEKEERWKENEEKMKQNDERMKHLDEQNKVLDEQNKAQKEEMKHLKEVQQLAIQNIMKTFNISEKDALALFS